MERGRFAHVVQPKDIDGKGLLQLSVSRLNDLFASSNKARNQKEGKLMMMMIHDDDDNDDDFDDDDDDT